MDIKAHKKGREPGSEGQNSYWSLSPKKPTGGIKAYSKKLGTFFLDYKKKFPNNLT